jgi:tetratricopeptide (TPR) repeat protein
LCTQSIYTESRTGDHQLDVKMSESSGDASPSPATPTSAHKSAGDKPGATKEISLGIPSWIILALLALTPAAFATGFTNFEFVKELLFMGGVGMALVVWGVQSVRARAVSMAAGRVTVLMLVFGVYALSATLWADNQLLGLWEALHFVALAATVLMITAPVGRPIGFYDFSVAAALGAGFAGAFGLLDLAGVGLFTMVWDPPGATGAFDAMEFATAYYVVALPVLLAAIFRFPGKARYVFAACFTLAGIHFAMVSGWAWAACFGGVCVATMLLVVVFQRSRSMLVLTPVVVLLGFVAVFLAVANWGFEPAVQTSDATSLPRVMASEGVSDAEQHAGIRNPIFAAGRTESVNDMLPHKYLMTVGSDFFADKPIVGHGAGSWRTLQTSSPHIDHPFVDAMFDLYPAFRSPHNGVTKLLVEYGVVGLTLFLLWLASTLVLSIKALAGRSEYASWILEHWALLTVGLAGLVFMLFTPLLELAPAALTWIVALAVLARFSASLNDFRGLAGVWGARSSSGRVVFNPVHLGAGVAALVGVGILVPTVLNCGAGYHRGQADQYMYRTMYEEAITAYEQAGEWYPAYGDVAYNISLASARLGRLGDAKEVIELAAEQRPWDVRVLTLLGRTRLGTPDESEAIGIARRAVKAFPNSVEARELLIASLDLQGRYEDAIDEADKFLDRAPPRTYRARFHMIAGDLYNDILKRYTQAVGHYKKALNLMDAPQQRAKLQEKVKQLEKTIENQRRRREGKPPLPDNVPNRGPHMPDEGHTH